MESAGGVKKVVSAAAAFSNIVELRTKVISMTTFFAAVLYSLYVEEWISPTLLGLMTAAVLCVDLGTTAFNSFFDYLRGVDHRSHTREGDKVLIKGEVSPGLALLISVVLYAAAAVLGITIAVLTGVEVAVAGAVCMAVGFLYNAGPLPISSTPAGELFAGGFLGSALFLISFYVFTGYLSLPAVWVSIPFTLYIASILAVNNACDVEGDAEAGRKTLAVICGQSCGRLLTYLLGGGAYALLAWCAYLGLFPVTLKYFLPPALVAALLGYRAMERRGYSHETKSRNMTAIVKLFALFGGTVLLSLGTAL
jgi:1,4-dihydroxy-2-naphthoate octaprenyltransferase